MEHHANQFAQEGEAFQFASRTLRLDPNIALAYAYSLNPTVKSTCDQLLSMYLDGLCCDVNVVWDVGTVLGTHRVLLAARSPVFSCGLNEIMDLSSNLNQSQDTAKRLRPNQLQDADGKTHYSKGIGHQDDNRWHR